MRIGIFGGTFDPVHLAHLALADAALEQLKLDELVFVPAGRNPLKRVSAEATGKQRLEMLRLATEGNARFAVSDIEVARKGPSYTIDTLHEMQHIMPGEYWVIMGADALETFGSWKSAARIIRVARLGVAHRPTVKPEVLAAKLPPEVVEVIDWIEMPPSIVSATEIRETTRIGRSAVLWTPKLVQQYIDQNRLYRS